MYDTNDLPAFLYCLAAGSAVLSGYGVVAIFVAVGLLIVSWVTTG